MTTTQQPVDKSSKAARSRALATVSATAAAAAIWLISDPLLGNHLEVERWDSGATTVVELPHVITTALLAALAGWGLLALLGKVTKRARSVWAITASAVLAVSLIGPVVSSVDVATATTLIFMHLAVGTVLIPAYAKENTAE